MVGDLLVELARRIAADPEAGAWGEWARELLDANSAEQLDQAEAPQDKPLASAGESDESPNWGRPRKPR